MHRSSLLHFLSLMLFSVLAVPVQSAWTVSYLHPTGATSSIGNGVSGVDEVGAAVIGGNGHAALWTGSAASFVDMNPPGAIASRLKGTDGAHQVGFYTPAPTIPPSHSYPPNFAGLWAGAPASKVSLHPSGGGYEPFSSANAIVGNLQVGDYSPNSEPSVQGAARWNGSATSYAALSPIGYNNGSALGTDGSSIAGYIAVPSGSSNPHAGVWALSPASFVDLNPAGASQSTAFDVQGNSQVGSARFGAIDHAALWSGSAASFEDMNPPGAISSVLRSIDGGYKVGTATFVGAIPNAGLWTGDAGSFLNLHLLLDPLAYLSSDANGVWSHGQAIKVIGTAFNFVEQRNEAVLWTFAVPEPGSLAVMSATLFSAWLSCKRTSLVSTTVLR